jgi:SAM-dependent methyltransferase
MSTLTSIVPVGIRRRIKRRLHEGTAYRCPLCHYSGKDLAPAGHDSAVLTERQVIGGGSRPSRCYGCNSTDRERLIYLYLKNELHLFDAATERRVLHIAPEKQLMESLLSAGLAEYVCGDLFTEGYTHSDYVRQIDVTDIPLEADTFDVVLCNHVLEHIIPDGTAMAELHRVLKPGGVAILQVPISANSAETFEDFSVVDPQQRERVFGQFDHVRIYGQDYPDRLRAHGFTVERVNVAQKYAQYGVDPREELFVCSK